MPYTVSNLNGTLQQQYQADPRLILALQAQQAGGVGMGPVQSPLEGLAKALSGVTGAYSQKKLMDEYGKKQDDQYSAIADALVPANYSDAGGGQSVALPGNSGLSASMPNIQNDAAGKHAQIVAALQSGLLDSKAVAPAIATSLGIGGSEYSQSPQQGINPSTGKAGMFVLDKLGNQKWLDASPISKISIAPNGVAYDPNNTAPGTTFADPNKPFAAGGIPNTAYQNYEMAKVAAGRAPTTLQQAQFAETQRHNRTMEGPNIMAGSGGSLPPLSKLPPQTQSVVKGMIEGRIAPPTSMAMSKPYWQNMIALATQEDPTFDQTNWHARVAANRDFTGGGKSYQLLNAGNTAIQHLGRLHSQIGDVSGMQVPLVGNLINRGINAAEQASGVPGLNAYNDTLGHLAEETTKFYRGTGGAESDIARNMSNLAANLSTDQKQTGVANTVHLIYGKLQPMVEQYNKTMGKNYPASHFLSKEAVKTLKSMGYDPDTGERLLPGSQSNSGTSQQTKIIDGKTYVNVNGKWYQQ
jgi:hypothetical protein